MAWTPFSAEAIRLDSQLRKLHAQGRISDALNVIVAALDKAHRGGPSNTSYEAFEAEVEKEASHG
jgi:hypothetical protein